MFLKSDNKISKKFALEISNLIDIQLQQVPFVDMNLSEVEVLRAKSCLAIYNFGFLNFLINSFLRFDISRLRSIIDKTYNEFFESFRKHYNNNYIVISEIVVNAEEQDEVLSVSREWRINYEINVRTPIHMLFPILYKIRIPKYLDKIGICLQNADKGVLLPFQEVVQLFSKQFGEEHHSEFASKFYFIINLETFNRITQIVRGAI